MPVSLTTPDWAGARNNAPVHVAFHAFEHVGARDFNFSRLDGWPMRSPVNASPVSSRISTHELGASAVRYTFTARDLHSLLLAGLPGAPKAVEPDIRDELVP